VVCPFVSPIEEEPMTLQVGLMARDGFVIASDRKASRDFRPVTTIRANISRTQVRGVASEIRKVLVSRNKNLVCAFSGDDLSKNMADALVASCPKQFSDDQAIEAYFKKTAEPFMFKGTQPENQLLIAGTTTPHYWLWRIFFFSGSVIVQRIHDKITGGDDANPAAYLLERFYRDDMPVADLEVLAAHFVLEGRHFSTQIRGLDILISKTGKHPRFLSQKELAALQRRSDSACQIFSEVLTSRERSK
jgi:hypothetical protein